MTDPFNMDLLGKSLQFPTSPSSYVSSDESDILGLIDNTSTAAVPSSSSHVRCLFSVIFSISYFFNCFRMFQMFLIILDHLLNLKIV